MNLHLIQDTVFLNDFADLLNEMGEISQNHFYVYYTESKNKSEFRHLIKEKFSGTTILDGELSELHLHASKYKNIFIHYLSDALFDFIERLPPEVTLVWCTWGSDFCGPDELFGHEILDKETFKYYTGRLRNKIIANIEVNKVPFSYRYLYDYAREKYWHSLRVKAAIENHRAYWAGYLKNKKKVLSRVNYLVNYGKEDYEFIYRNYGIRHEYIPFFYTAFSDEDNTVAHSDYFKKMGIPTGSKIIFIGNCGTVHNNHLDLIPLLKKIRSAYTNVAFVLPLSYGEKEYINFISDKFRNEFGNSFFPIYDFIEKEEYYKMLNSIDVMFMNHNRNQGGTNLFKAIYYGKKVFVKDNNPLAKHLREHGVILDNIEGDWSYQIKELFTPLKPETIERNKKAITSVFSVQMAKNGFRNILNKIN